MLDLTLLITAISVLAGAIAMLWRQLLVERNAADADRREASRLIFALLQQRASARGETAPPTVSTPAEPQFGEAKKLASRALNGDIEKLLTDFLASDRPPKRTMWSRP